MRVDNKEDCKAIFDHNTREHDKRSINEQAASPRVTVVTTSSVALRVVHTSVLANEQSSAQFMGLQVTDQSNAEMEYANILDAG